MAIDTQTLASIGDVGSAIDPAKSQQKALSIKDMMDREQMNKLNLGQAKQEAATNSQVQDYLKGQKYDTPEGVMRTAEGLNKISPKASMEFQTNAAKITSGKVQGQLDQYELLDHQQGLIVNAIDPIVAQARQIKQQSGQLAADAFVAQQLPGALQQLQGTKLPNGQTALSQDVIKQVQEATKQGPIGLATMEAFEAKSKQGQAAMKQRIEQLKADTGAAGERERERHDQAMEGNAARNTGDREKKNAPGPESRTRLLAAIAERGVNLPTGLRNKETQNATLDGLIAKHPEMTPEQIADKLATGTLSFGAEKKESTTLATRQAGIAAIENTIIAPGGFLDQAETAVNAVNFPKLKAAGQFDKWSKDQLSDPDLAAYRASIAELRQEYAIVLSKGGQVTDASRHEAGEVVPDIVTPAQFQKIKGVIKRGIETAKQGVGDALNESEGKQPAPAAGAPAPFSDADKERRYQQWKAQHPNG